MSSRSPDLDAELLDGLCLDLSVDDVDLVLGESPLQATVDDPVAVRVHLLLLVEEAVKVFDLLNEVTADRTDEVVEVVGREFLGGQPETKIVPALGVLAHSLEITG